MTKTRPQRTPSPVDGYVYASKWLRFKSSAADWFLAVMFAWVFAWVVLFWTYKLRYDLGYVDDSDGLTVFFLSVPMFYCGLALFFNLVLPILSWGRSTPGHWLVNLTILNVDHQNVGPIRMLAREFLRRFYLVVPSVILLTGYALNYSPLFLEGIENDLSPLRRWIEEPRGPWDTATAGYLITTGWVSMFLGWLIALFVIPFNYLSIDTDPKRQSWYDKLLGTVVLKRNV